MSAHLPVQLPRLDLIRCSGCGVCVDVCPTHCLEMNGNRPWLPRPLDCVSCRLCELVCPTRAITMQEPVSA